MWYHSNTFILGWIVESEANENAIYVAFTLFLLNFLSDPDGRFTLLSPLLIVSQFGLVSISWPLGYSCPSLCLHHLFLTCEDSDSKDGKLNRDYFLRSARPRCRSVNYWSLADPAGTTVETAAPVLLCSFHRDLSWADRMRCRFCTLAVWERCWCISSLVHRLVRGSALFWRTFMDLSYWHVSSAVCLISWFLLLQLLSSSVSEYLAFPANSSYFLLAFVCLFFLFLFICCFVVV